MNNKIIDLFCGCGGLSKGFEEAGFEVVKAFDFWKDAIKTYNNNHKNPIAECRDIKEITEHELNKINVNNDIAGVIGGPPCQGFSTVGTREKNDPRNVLYKEYCRIVKTINPDFFVLENVKGLLTLDDGSFKNSIVKTFTDLGYSVEYKVVNASKYGVPQNRERIFFVGMKGKKFEFPSQIEKIVSTSDALDDLPNPSHSHNTNAVCNYGKTPRTDFQRYLRGDSKEIHNHIDTSHSQATIDIISLIPDGGAIKDLPKEYWDVRKYNKAFQRMNSKKPSNTIDTGHRNYFHYKENRIPTARESARIQSFKDDFIFLGSKTSQLKQIGNAVPPLLAREVALAIKKQLV